MNYLDQLSACLELLDAQSPLSDVIAGDISMYLEKALMFTVKCSFASATDCI